MWKCPNCKKEYDGDRCLECGIENLGGKAGNIVGRKPNEEYFMVSADFFKKKKMNVCALIGFILSVSQAVLWISIPVRGIGFCSRVVFLVDILSIVLSVIGIKRYNAKTQRGYKLAVAGTYIVILSVGALFGIAVGHIYRW